MADIITETPPCRVIIDGKEVSVNTDFRVWMKLDDVMSDRNISDEEKAVYALKSVYGGIPENTAAAFVELLRFFKGDSTDSKQKAKTSTNTGTTAKAIYSFKYDSEYIYAAFMEQYHIDLSTAQLHWWQFKALFKGLNENILFSKIMGYRSIELSEIKDKQLRKKYSRLKELYALPDMRSEEEKEADWGAAF